MASDPPTPDFVPQGYSVVQRLGAGQTSVVYLAGHGHLGRVALKLPREAAMRDHTLRRMFENEVQITLKLKHPNIVRAYDGYPTGRRAHLVLEYCSGGTLDQRLLEGGRMTLERTFDLILDIGRGLGYTHDKRVLHRDIKPANVFLDGEGRAKLGDFGTGAFMAEKDPDRVGTAFYMAPEIFEGQAPNVRSDIYSLGVLAYELLTGSRPFVGASYEELMIKHLKEVPRNPRTMRDDLPRGVAATVLKAMNRSADNRFATVEAFLDALLSATGRDAAPEAGDGEIPTGRAGRARSAQRRAEERDEDSENTENAEDKGGLFGWFRRNRGG